jgi:hypothetical protein
LFLFPSFAFHQAEPFHDPSYMGRPGRYERQRAKQSARTDKQQQHKQTPTDKASERREQISTDIIAAIADTAARTAAATARAILEQQQGSTL